MELEAQKIAELVKEGGLVCLYGDLGSGKTTLTKKVANLLGIDDFKVKSPTYTYIRRYDLNSGQNFYHLDLYRLESLDVIFQEEIEEIIANPENIVFIEWPQRMEEHLPAKRTNIHITYPDRKIRIEDYLSNS